MNTRICTICQTELVGAYCHNCGQHDTGKRVNFTELISDFVSAIFSLERSVLGTLRYIVLDPLKVIQNYWAGYRNYYHSPGKLAFYALFFIGLHFAFIGKDFLGVHFRTNTNLSAQVALLILFLPLLTTISWLTYFRRGYHFLEHFIAITYLFSTWAILFVIIDDLTSLLLPGLLKFDFIIIFLPTLFIWVARVFSKNQYWTSILVNTLLEILFFILVVIVLVGLLYLINPSSVKMDVSS
ncbi:MAG: hypothetical protein ACK4TA_07520 [Saprospiraceae bacterium]